MAVLLNEYDEKNLVDKTWYDSSNIYYSEIIDKENELKDLIVVFNDGRKYVYKEVSVIDALFFRNGGIDNSQGKALYKYIAVKVNGEPKYKYERLENVDVKVLEEEKKNKLIV